MIVARFSYSSSFFSSKRKKLPFYSARMLVAAVATTLSRASVSSRIRQSKSSDNVSGLIRTDFWKTAPVDLIRPFLYPL